ncbi:MAG: hypothetical protein KTR18_02765 [Acidiferrobacterales bacterium]|nr:hypothetical protein [Acidiferrobacterales bacterium]
MAKKLKTFLITYHSGAAAQKKMQNSSMEEMNAVMGEWMAWAKKCGKSLEEMGAPLHNSVNIKVKGPAVPSTRKITGYSKIRAESLAACKKFLKNHPHLKFARGCEIEVHEVMPMG